MGYFCCLVLFVFIVGTSASEWSANDGKNRAVRCLEQIIHDGEISNLLIDVTTPEKIDDFCRRHAELQKCVRENEHYMSVKENTEYLQKTSGVHNFYVNVCPPGTDITADYKGNSPCFKLIRNEILSCGSNLPDMNSFKMKNDIRSRCCALKTHNQCLKKVTLENCGKEAGNAVEKILQRYFDRKLKECNSSSSNCSDERDSVGHDWASSTNSDSTKWKLLSTRDYRHRTTEMEDWKRSTPADKKVEWKRVTDENAWKKHHHSSATELSVNVAASVMGCFVTLLLHKL